VHIRGKPLTPLAAVLAGLVAGAASFGAAVWAAGYVLLPAGGLYRPIWKYDAKTLASDLSAHLAYGAGTGAAFWVLARI